MSTCTIAELFTRNPCITDAPQAGLPPGVLNVVVGLGSEAGAPLTIHDGVDKLAFTGR